MTLEYTYLKSQASARKGILLVFHGLGSDQFNLQPALSFASHYDRYFFQAPLRPFSLFDAIPCASWYSWEKDFALTLNNHKEMETIGNQIVAILKQADPELSVPLHALGFSQGGVMALSLAHHLSLKTLAMLASFYDFHSDHHPLHLGQTSCFCSYSGGDTIVHPSLSYSTIEALQTKAKYVDIYRDDFLGHAIDSRVMQAYQRFLEKSSV